MTLTATSDTTDDPVAPPAAGGREAEPSRRLRRLGTVWRSYRNHAELLYAAAPVQTVVALILTLLSAVATTASVLLLGQVVGAGVTAVEAGPGTPEAAAAMTWVLWLAIAFLAGVAAGVGSNVLGQRIMANGVAHASMLLAELASEPVGIEHLEDSGRAGRLQALVKTIHEWTYLEGLAATWVVLQSRLTALGSVAIVAMWHWWAALALAAGYLISGRALTTWLLSVFNDMVLQPPLAKRRSEYVFGLLMKGPAAKEIRLFGLSPWLIERYRTLWTSAMVKVWKGRNATMGPVFATTLLLTAAAVLVYTTMGIEAWDGDLSVSTLTALVTASLGMMGLSLIGDAQILLTQSMSATSRIRAGREEVGLPPLRPRPAVPSVADRPTGHEPAEITFSDVSFTYPSREEAVFEGLNLTIPAGQSVAVVGVNGAGKSTLIKLLCGLYTPTSGTVSVDRLNPAVDARARERVAVIFQDFVRYHLSLKENVALGARNAADVDAVVRQALHDAAGDDIVARLDDDWDTVLSGEYEGGTDLSGGQWQRVALARALAAIAGGSGVLVLDEPTAALDVRAEAQLFDRFLDVTRGMTTLLVSHRLSSVRHADRIVVIDQGRIVEDGSHDELLTQGGHYARMFTLQASRFAAASGNGVDLDDAEETEESS